jgi:hypothetical protein
MLEVFWKAVFIVDLLTFMEAEICGNLVMLAREFAMDRSPQVLGKVHVAVLKFFLKDDGHRSLEFIAFFLGLSIQWHRGPLNCIGVRFFNSFHCASIVAVAVQNRVGKLVVTRTRFAVQRHFFVGFFNRNEFTT